MNTTFPFYFKELSDKNETIISLENGYLKVISIGEKNQKFSRNLWQNIIEACEECECYKILGVALTTKAEEEHDAFKHVELFNDLGIDHDYKIAWIEKNPEFQERVKFFETVFYNRSLPGKIFDKEEDAKNWLLDN